MLSSAGAIRTLTLSAEGGNGGSQLAPSPLFDAEAEGGGGGYVLYTNPGAQSNPTLNTAGGLNGITNSPSLLEFPPNGATRGASGTSAPTTYAAQCAITADVTTTISGTTAAVLAGSTITYTVSSTNAGPNPATNVVQTIQLPAGLTGVTVSSGSYNPANGLVTFGPIASLGSGAAAVTNTVSFAAPTGAPSVTGKAASTSGSTDPGTANNDGSAANANITTPIGGTNQPPVANSVTNAALDNTLAATVLTPSLSATDSDGTIASFTIQSLPANGILAFNGTAVTVGQVVLASQLSQLTFDPNPGYVGSASFTYTATDNAGLTSANTATYTIPVGSTCGPSYAGGGTASAGLYGQYYAGNFSASADPADDDLSYFNGRTPGVSRFDSQLDFATDTWGSIVPPAQGTSTDPNFFSARFRGSISVPTAGLYTFYLSSDDASYLWLDGAALAATPTAASATINNGGLHGSTTVAATVMLSAGSHNVLIFFGEANGSNSLKFEYAGPTGSGIVRQVVPVSVLCASLTNVPPVATNVTNSPAMPSTNGPTMIQSLAGTDQDGTITNYIIATLPPATQGVLSLNGTAVTAGQQITAAQAAQLQFDPVAGFAGDATFTFLAVDNANQQSNAAATYTIPVVAVTTISGIIFEDVNYGGGVGRSLTDATGVSRGGATVELYNASGILVATTTTATTGTVGSYSFGNVATGTYTVRVVNGTVTSSRNTSNVSGLIGVQTFVNGNVNRVGGKRLKSRTPPPTPAARPWPASRPARPRLSPSQRLP